jgi:two-component system sensor histidine kinase KdpD
MNEPYGRLRVYLGMAPGVGKTYAMLQEAHRRRARGEDVVVGFVETYGRPATDALVDGLEVVPRRRVDHRGVAVEEMDAEAIVARSPAVVLVDELAHTNAPGSLHEKRWEDIEALRDAGIDVISTCNVQHVESVADAVEALIGAPVHERVPDDVLRGADEIELVDLTPSRLRRRIGRGEVYPPDRASVALERFFTEGNLTALRDLALHFVGGEVDAALWGSLSEDEAAGPADSAEKVMAVLDGTDASRRVLQRAAAIARRLHAPLFALVVDMPRPGGIAAGEALLEEVEASVAESGGDVLIVPSGDLAAAIARLVRLHRITRLVLAQPHRGRLARLAGDPLLDRILRLVPDLEISLVGPGRSVAEAPQPTF